MMLIIWLILAVISSCGMLIMFKDKDEPALQIHGWQDALVKLLTFTLSPLFLFAAIAITVIIELNDHFKRKNEEK